MALVQRHPRVAQLAGGAAGVAALAQQLVPWLQTRLGNYADEQIQRLANELATDFVNYGGQLQHVGATIRQFVEDQGGRMNERVQNWITQMSQQVQTAGDAFIREINNAEGQPRLRGQDQLMLENGEDSLSNLPPGASEDPTDGMDIEMEDAPPPQQAALRATGGATPGNPVSKETPISRYPSLTYGLQETHTTILPWCGYCSTTGMDHASPNVIELRLTQPHDVIQKNMQGLAVGDPWGKDVYVVPYNNANNRDTATAPTFPSTLDTGSATTEKASWWEYWRKFYEYYTVLACEYQILIENPNSDRGTDVCVGWDFNSYSDTAGASGNKTPQDQRLSIMKEYKGIQWRTIEQCSTQMNKESKVMIKGTYKPGQARRNIQNDGDVKTWIKTNNGGTPDSPTLKEFLTLYFYRGELSWLKAATKTLGVNMEIKLKYIVQFKDLRNIARYPNTTDTDISVTIDTDVHQFPTA